MAAQLRRAHGDMVPHPHSPSVRADFLRVGLRFWTGTNDRPRRIHGKDLDLPTFMSPGVIAVAVMFWSYFETTYPTFVRMFYQKTFDAILSTPLLVEDVIVGEILWGATKSVMAGIIMTAILSLFGLLSWPHAAWILPICVVGGILFSSVGVLTTALSPNIDTFNVPIFVFIFPMFLFSGTFFPLDLLPTWAVSLAYLLPLTHVSILIRGAALGYSQSAFALNWAYLLIVLPVVFFLALRTMKRRLTQ